MQKRHKLLSFICVQTILNKHSKRRFFISSKLNFIGIKVMNNIWWM